MVEKESISKSDEEWKKHLSDVQFEVCRKKSTEPPLEQELALLARQLPGLDHLEGFLAVPRREGVFDVDAIAGQ